jgi:hypothetical protein
MASRRSVERGLGHLEGAEVRELVGLHTFELIGR